MRAVFLFLLVLVAPIVVMAQSNTTGIMHRASGTPGPTPTPTLPPQGIYYGCEIDAALTTTCESAESQMVSDGFTIDVNYIGLMAHKTGTQSLQAWFTYDASIGMTELINIKGILTDNTNPANPLTASPTDAGGLTNGDANLPNDCSATTNQQVLQCVINLAATIPGFHYMWYLADEPGWSGNPGASYGSNAFTNFGTVASWLATNDPAHPVISAQTGDGGQTSINNLGSWLMGANSPSLLWDWYNWPPYMFNEPITYQSTLMADVSNTINATYSSELFGYVGLASAGSQSDISFGGGYCGNTYTLCPFPTASQMQETRDQALWYAKANGHPLSYILWYAWEDTTCVNGYPAAGTGFPASPACNATNNRTALRTAAFAPYPVTKPAYGPAIYQQCVATASNSCTFNNQVNLGDLYIAIAGDSTNAPTCNAGWTTIQAYTATYVKTVGCSQVVSSGGITPTPFAGTATSRSIQVWEVSGSSLAVDTFTGGESASSATQTLTIAPTGTNDLILSAAWQSTTGTSSIAVPSNSMVDTYCNNGCFASLPTYAAVNQANSSSGSQTLTWTFTGSSRVISSYAVAISGTLNP